MAVPSSTALPPNELPGTGDPYPPLDPTPDVPQPPPPVNPPGIDDPFPSPVRPPVPGGTPMPEPELV